MAPSALPWSSHAPTQRCCTFCPCSHHPAGCQGQQTQLSLLPQPGPRLLWCCRGVVRAGETGGQVTSDRKGQDYSRETFQPQLPALQQYTHTSCILCLVTTEQLLSEPSIFKSIPFLQKRGRRKGKKSNQLEVDSTKQKTPHFASQGALESKVDGQPPSHLDWDQQPFTKHHTLPFPSSVHSLLKTKILMQLCRDGQKHSLLCFLNTNRFYALLAFTSRC